MIWHVVIAIAATSIVLVAIQTSRIAIIRAIQKSSEEEKRIMGANQDQLVELKTVLTAVVAQQNKVLTEIGALADRAERDNIDPNIVGDLRGLVDQLQGGVKTLDDYTPDQIEAEEGETTPPATETPETPAETLPGDADTGDDTGTEVDPSTDVDPEDAESETSQP